MPNTRLSDKLNARKQMFEKYLRDLRTKKKEPAKKKA